MPKSAHLRTLGLQLIVVTAMAVTAPAQAEPVKLKFNYISNETDKTYNSIAKPYLDAIEREAKGLIQIDRFFNGALGRSNAQQAQIILDGVADIGVITPPLTPARFADNRVLEMPAIFPTLREASYAHTRLTQAGRLRGYEDYFVMGAIATTPQTIHARKPIKSLADLNGMKLVATTSIAAPSLKALGAVPVPLSVLEITEAIGRGTVDGTLVSLNALVDFNITRVTSHDYYLTFGATPLALVMNRKKFETLPKEAQDVLRKYSGDWFAETWIRLNGEYINEEKAKLKADPKRQGVEPTEADRKLASDKLEAVRAELLAQDARFPVIYKQIQSDLASLKK